MNKMKYRISLYLFVFLSLYSCKNEKAGLISDFNSLYHDTAYKDYPEKLNATSQAFYNKITDSSYFQVDSMVALGLEYNIPYFTTLYMASCGDVIKQSGKKEDFFLYLAASDISFFSNQEDYYVQEEKSRIEKDAWVCIYRKEGGQNYNSWVRYEAEESGLNLDLMYTLSMQEKRYKKIYDEFKVDYPDLTKHEYYKAIFSMYNNQNCPITDIKKKISS